MLYILPIEPLEERYSADWLRWLKAWLKTANVDNFIIDPKRERYDKIQHGQFLDAIGTNQYKAKQLETLTQIFADGYVKDGDIIWVHDLWFPGIEMVAYMRNALNLKIRIYGMLHAGTYDPYDFITQCGMRAWGRHLEKAWLTMADGVFVATQFHENLLWQDGNDISNVHKVPFPMYWDKPEPDMSKKEDLIVFPHRLAPEKGISLWSDFKKLAQAKGWQCMATKEVCQNKQEYYDILRRAKYAVSFAKQETWGIAMQEAILCGCVPVMPNQLSYEEMYMPDFLYDYKIEPVRKCWEQLCMLDTYYQNAVSLAQTAANSIISKGKTSFDTMLAIMTQQGVE